MEVCKGEFLQDQVGKKLVGGIPGVLGIGRRDISRVTPSFCHVPGSTMYQVLFPMSVCLSVFICLMSKRCLTLFTIVLPYFYLAWVLSSLSVR